MSTSDLARAAAPAPAQDVEGPPATLTVHWSGIERADRPTLVLLHGLGDSGECWPDAVSRWGADHRIASLDLLGHGTSPRFTPSQLAAPDPMEAMYAAAEAAVAAVAAAGGPVALVAHSMGGGVASALTARRPDLVSAAVLEEPAWRDPADRVMAQDVVDERIADCIAFRTDPEGSLALGRHENPGWPESEYGPWALSKTQVDLDFLRAGVASFDRPWEEFVAAYDVPVLVVAGGASPLVGPDIRRRALDVGNRRLRLEVFPEVGHCVRRERPDAFHGLVDRWLAGALAA